MPLWKLPPIPGISQFLFGACVLILVIGLSIYVTERRKEIKKENARDVQS